MTSTSNASTGPRTDSGKFRSSQNSLKTGLFAAHDYILETEREEYAETFHNLLTELHPKGILEETFTSEIMSANWRLRRCHLIEANFATRELAPDQVSAEQKSVDRARAHSHSILRRSIAELRKLQTERFIRAELAFNHLTGLADSRQLLNSIKAYDRHHAWQDKSRAKAAQADTLLEQLAQADARLGMSGNASRSYPGECNQPGTSLVNEGAFRTYPGECGQPGTPLVSSFCNPTLSSTAANAGMTARNAPCPCGSGEKYKRCCGKDAPPVLNLAA